MEKLCAKSILVGDNQRSFRSSRTAPLYNIQDFLPPTGLLSRTIITQPRPHKIYTEPFEQLVQLPRNDHQTEELKRKIESIEFKKAQAQLKATKFQKRVQELEIQGKIKQQRIRDLIEKLDSFQRANDELNAALIMKPSLELDRNCTHLILYPKHQQRYQVSIQTDPVEANPVQASHFTAQSKNSDLQMLQIEDRLSRLTLGKIGKKQAKSANLFKGRFAGSREDKQNNMKSSNTFDHLGTIPDEKIRQENIQILPVDNDRLQRLIQLYMD